MTDGQPYHETEIALQERTGRRSLAEALAARIWNEIASEVIEFLPTLPFVVAGSLDDDGRPWASILAGRPGFLDPDKKALRIKAQPTAADPLYRNLERGGDLGLIGIDFARRRRFRVNGQANLDGQGILLKVAQCYRNCPQYIHAREAVFEDRAAPSSVSSRRMDRLDAEAIRIVSKADTFFIATHGGEGPASDTRLGADVSHRGGNPGFVVLDETNSRLSFPDYIGNFMFNTLGNLTRYPRCGLLLVDFDSGSTLQITGRAKVDWELARATTVPGAQRMIDVEIEQAILTEAALPLSWRLIEPARDLRRYRPPTPSVSSTLAGSPPGAPPLQEGFTPVVVSSVVDEADHIRSFYLRPKTGTLLPFRAGQYVRIRLPIHGAPSAIVRHYSLSNYDAAPREYRIGVRRSDSRSPTSGSNWLHDHVPEGFELEIGRPEGSFILAPESERPVALISVGSGVTPVLAMLHALAGSETRRPVWFVHGARNGAEQAYASEIRRLSDRFANFKAHFRYSRPRDVDFMGRDHDSVGRVDADLLRTMIPEDADFYLCGPLDFMTELKAALIGRNIPRERIRIEAFGTGSSRPGAPGGLNGAKVRFADSDTELTWRDGFENILELAEAAGLAPMHSCRAGSCGSCEHALAKGQVAYPQAPLFDFQPGNVLLCCSKPLSDLVIGSPIGDSRA